MRSAFPGHFANRSKNIQLLWKECIFVLDANVLLSLYRFSDATRSELFQVFYSLQDRLWIPNQVAQEYLDNRLSVIADQAKTYDESIKKVENLKKGLENLNIPPFVTPALLSKSATIFKSLLEEFNENKKLHERRIYDDEIKDELELLFEGRVGTPFSRQEMENIIEQGKQRYEERIPPGFSDAKKGGESSLFLDRCKPYGDYVVWLQMIAKSKLSKESIIFVTGDVKEDWWLSSQGKTVGPLPALIQEFEAETGSAFYMYTPHKFLERANKYLEQDVSQNAVDEIKSAEEADQSDKKNSDHSFAIKKSMLKGYLSSSEPYLKWINKRHEIVTTTEMLRRELERKREIAKLLTERKQKTEQHPDSEISAYLDNEISANARELKYLEQEIQYTKIMLDECERHIYTIEENAALSMR